MFAGWVKEGFASLRVALGSDRLHLPATRRRQTGERRARARPHGGLGIRAVDDGLCYAGFRSVAGGCWLWALLGKAAPSRVCRAGARRKADGGPRLVGAAGCMQACRRSSSMLLPRLLLRTPAIRAAYVVAAGPHHAFRAFHASCLRRAIDMEKVNTTERLAELRRLMQERHIDVYSMHPPSAAMFAHG